MRIACVGGGPAGLVLGILLRLHARSGAGGRGGEDHQVVVHERNRKGETFGFGVVFSDETLSNLAAADPVLYRAIEAAFIHWTDCALHLPGPGGDVVRVRLSGHGFSGIARVRLLAILEARAEELGVVLHHASEVAAEALLPDFDLVVASDGVWSATRNRYEADFQPAIDLGKAVYTWLGTTKKFDALTFVLARTPHGLFQAHAYPYESGRGTFIVETHEAAWKAAGLEAASPEESRAILERIFAAELEGHPLLSNRSTWIRFPTLRCERWSRGKLVLLGDAAHTAHFSVGSGTKLAVEDAIALAKALGEAPDVESALRAFEAARRLEVSKTQRAADDSRATFEELESLAETDPDTLFLRLLTRTKGLTWENLRLRDASFVERIEARYARARGKPGAEERVPPMFTPFQLADRTLANRVVVSPMCMYSAKDGLVGPFHVAHLGVRAMGGAGLVMAEMTAVSPAARITLGCAGLWSPAHRDGWKAVVDFVHAHSGAAIGIQLGHAGRKGLTKLPWEGTPDEPLLGKDAWDLVSASPLAYLEGGPIPRELDRSGMDALVREYEASARYALEAGFDVLEIHMAHGYLLASFLSPLTNRRRDEYGGNVAGRLRFPLEVTRAVRTAWPKGRPLSVRISATDWAPGGLTGDDAIAIAKALKEAGVDLIDVSTGQTVPDAKPRYGRMYQVPFAERIRHAAGVPVMTVGAVTTPDQINTILASGRADLVALARPHLADPHFTHRAAVAAGYGPLAWPMQYGAVAPR